MSGAGGVPDGANCHLPIWPVWAPRGSQAPRAGQRKPLPGEHVRAVSLDALEKSGPTGQSHRCDRGSREQSSLKASCVLPERPGPPSQAPGLRLTVRAGRAAEAHRGLGPAGAGPRPHRPLGLREHRCEWLSYVGPTPPLGGAPAWLLGVTGSPRQQSVQWAWQRPRCPGSGLSGAGMCEKRGDFVP